MSIAVHNISRRYGAFTALRDVSLQVETGELVALLGPSGSGKTTLLRIIAGLESADSGTVHLSGDDATGRSPGDRQVGFVFQHYALFRHMSVFENVAFGLRVRPRRLRPTEAEIKKRVHALLQLVQLDWLANRYPAQLSGGQRQRVALARALAVEPKVLLLDEPFGALDAKVRAELRRWLRRLHDELHITSVFVTHDQEEALEVADRVVVMNQGVIEQIGTPAEVYDQPASAFVYDFLGTVNRFHGRVSAGRLHAGGLDIAVPELNQVQDFPAVGYVRPHDVQVERRRGNAPGIAALIDHVHAVGPVVRLSLRRCDTGELVEAELTKDRYQALGLQANEPVFLEPRKLRVFIDQQHATAN